MKLRLPYPPSANVYWRHVQGRTLVSKEARAYKERARWLALQQLGRMAPLEGDVFLGVTVYRPRRVGDLGNRLKVLEDALEGVCFLDDAQVAEIHMLRLDDRADPRVEVTVSPFNPHD